MIVVANNGRMDHCGCGCTFIVLVNHGMMDYCGCGIVIVVVNHIGWTAVGVAVHLLYWSIILDGLLWLWYSFCSGQSCLYTTVDKAAHVM